MNAINVLTAFQLCLGVCSFSKRTIGATIFLQVNVILLYFSELFLESKSFKNSITMECLLHTEIEKKSLTFCKNETLVW